MDIETKASASTELKGGVVPCLMIRDANEAADFYEKAFGGQVQVKTPDFKDPNRLLHCHMIINGGSLIFNDAFPEAGHPLVPPQAYVLHLQVDDADAWWKRAIDAGCVEVMKLEKQFWGDRYGQVRDPYGVTWSIAEAG